MANTVPGVISMNLIERCRRYAIDCLKVARSATSDDQKSQLLQMAETWRQLAERAEAKADARDDEKNTEKWMTTTEPR
jgi:hypothetical protein